MAKRDPKGFVTNEILDDAVESILNGVDSLLKEQKKTLATKEDLKQFATKKDLKQLEERALEKFATKEDLKREIMWVRGDIRDLKADLSDTPSRQEFNQLKDKVGKYLSA